MLRFYRHYMPAKQRYFFSLQTRFMYFSSTMIRLRVRISSIKVLLVRHFPDDMLFISFVCVISERASRVWNWTTIDIHEIVTALSFLSFGRVLAFLPVHRKAVVSNIPSFYFLVFVFSWKVQGVWQGALNAYYRECWAGHLAVRGWQSLTAVVQVYSLLLITRLYSDFHWGSVFLVMFHDTKERRRWIWNRCLGHIAS